MLQSFPGVKELITHHTHTPLQLIDATDQSHEEHPQSCLLHPTGHWPALTTGLMCVFAPFSVLIYANLCACMHAWPIQNLLRTCKANVTIFTLKGHCCVIHLCAALTCIFSKHKERFFSYMGHSLYTKEHSITSFIHTPEDCCFTASWIFRDANLSGWPTQTIRSHCLWWVRTAGRKQISCFTAVSNLSNIITL